MANAPNTQSTLTYPSGNNKTSTALSTNILIMVNGFTVGAIQDISITESRTIQTVKEIGTDGIIDSAPNASTDIQVTCNRIRFDRLRIAQAFNRAFIHASSQAYPFDIVIIDKQSGNVGAQITTVIKNCWIKRIQYTYRADNWIISEAMDLQAETIYSFLNQGNTDIDSGGAQNSVALAGSERGDYKPANIGIERQTDTGANGRRGSMDAAGLIDIGNSSSYY